MNCSTKYLLWISPYILLQYRDERDKGWRSERNCTYPQHLVIRLAGNSCSLVELEQIKILVDEECIPTKVEVFVGRLSENNSCHTAHDQIVFADLSDVQRLGYILFDSNKKSNYQGRELRTVSVGGIKASFLKLNFYGCFEKKLNEFNQIGILSLSLSGNPVEFKPSSLQYKVENILQLSPSSDKKKVFHQNEVVDNTAKQSQLANISKDIEYKLKKFEKEKKRRAAVEDYEGAAIVKKALINAQSSYDLLRETNSLMLQAAANEDYEEARVLKEKRDKAIDVALQSLKEATESVGFITDDVPFVEEPKSATYQGNSNSSKVEQQQTARVDYDSESSRKKEKDVESLMNTPSFEIERTSNDTQNEGNHNLSSSSPILTKLPALSNSSVPCSSHMTCESNAATDGQTSSSTDENNSNNNGVIKEIEQQVERFEFTEENHPLEGVPGYEALPDPRDVSIRGENILLSKRIEELVGSYIMKCFFSRNWALREAALTKSSLLLPDMKENHGLKKIAPVICEMLERSLCDRVVQVFLTSLILLDDCLVEFEEANMSSRKVIAILDKVIRCLMGKLAESKHKVVDGAETTLLSFALSPCIGPSLIGSAAVKDLSSQEKKSGRGITNRLKLLRKLIEEFGDEAVTGKRVFSFITGMF